MLGGTDVENRRHKSTDNIRSGYASTDDRFIVGSTRDEEAKMRRANEAKTIQERHREGGSGEEGTVIVQR